MEKFHLCCFEGKLVLQTLFRQIQLSNLTGRGVHLKRLFLFSSFKFFYLKVCFSLSVTGIVVSICPSLDPTIVGKLCTWPLSFLIFKLVITRKWGKRLIFIFIAKQSLCPSIYVTQSRYHGNNYYREFSPFPVYERPEHCSQFQLQNQRVISSLIFLLYIYTVTSSLNNYLTVTGSLLIVGSANN